jgi:hypothetical protein
LVLPVKPFRAGLGFGKDPLVGLDLPLDMGSKGTEQVGVVGRFGCKSVRDREPQTGEQWYDRKPSLENFLPGYGDERGLHKSAGPSGEATRKSIP